MTTKTIEEMKRFREGSRKNKTYTRFVKVSEKAAREYARKSGIKDSTIAAWFSSWKREKKAA